MSQKIEKIFSPIDKVFIVGGGSSLKGFDFNLLENCKTIAVNYSYKHVPNFDCLVAIDFQFYQKSYEELRCIDKPIYALSNYHWSKEMTELGVIGFKNTGVDGVDYNEGCVRSGGNSGYTAIGVAIQLGAKDIRLLGFDMNNNGHYYSPEKFSYDIFYFTSKLFNKMKEELKPDIKITNYSPISRITVFEKRDLSMLFKD